MEDKIREGNGGLSKDTELLTPTGWLNITEVTKETLVAQYSIDGYISFAQPVYLGNVYARLGVRLYNNNGNYDQLVGIYHAIPYIRNENKNMLITSANRALSNSHRKYLNTGVLSNGCLCFLTTLDRLRIAFQADGNIKYSCKNSDYIVFKFTKKRKIERLHGLLKETDIEYKISNTKGGYTNFYFLAPNGFYEKNFGWINLANVSETWCREFIEELSHWDSYVHNKSHFCCQYYNNRKLAIDRAQAVATLAGYRTSLFTKIHGNPNHNTSYILTIVNNTKSIEGKSLIVKIIDYHDTMCEVVIPSNMLVIRHNDAVSITGCGNHDARLSKDQVINTNCGHLV